jgi:hypothetical protein
MASGMLMSLLIAAVAASVITGLVAPVLGIQGQNWIRRIFLTLVNLHPMNWGTWRKELTKREAVFACWFLIFLVVFVVGSAWGDGQR